MRRPPYPVMSSKDIKELPVYSLANDDCILFCWTTDYHLTKCIEIITAWGFTYKTVGFVWSKRNKDNTPVCFMGAYTMKSGVELCLLATKGKNATKMVINHSVRSYIESPREKHSKKPDRAKNQDVEWKKAKQDELQLMIVRTRGKSATLTVYETIDGEEIDKTMGTTKDTQEWIYNKLNIKSIPAFGIVTGKQIGRAHV